MRLREIVVERVTVVEFRVVQVLHRCSRVCYNHVFL